MTDIEIAKAHLPSHSICLCKDGEYFTNDGRGISPMIRFIAEKRDLQGYSVADVIVGKAAAMLFIKAEIAEVYAEVMSESGYSFLKEHAIPCSYATLTKRIINRKGDGICPMEEAVVGIHDVEQGYLALKSRLAQLQKK